MILLHSQITKLGFIIAYERSFFSNTIICIPLVLLHLTKLLLLLNILTPYTIVSNYPKNENNFETPSFTRWFGQTCLTMASRLIKLQASYVPAVRAARNKTTDRFQGFCCSCEDAQRAESFRSVAAKSNYYQRYDGANRARNRSVSSANLFDNSEAQRQVETSGKEEPDRQVGSGDARGRVTSRNTSAVNGPLGERTSPLREQQEEKQLKNNSVRPRGGVPWAENANRTESLPSALENMFSDPSPSKGKIEAYIDAVYEQAMKERAMKQAIKHESDKRSKGLSVENDLAAGSSGDSDGLRESDRRILERISDGRSSTYGPVNLRTTEFIGDYDFRKLKSREFNPQFLARRSDGRSLIRGSVADDPRDPTTKLTKLEGEQGFAKMGCKEDNRELALELEKCERAVNFSESRTRGEMARDRSRAVAQPENTFDYTPTFPATHSSRIPEGSPFSRRTEKNAFLNGESTLPDNGSDHPATVEFFIRPGISFRNNIDEDINCDDVASSTVNSNGLEENMLALLSKITMSEIRLAEGAGRQHDGFRASENVSGNVNALRNVPVVRKNLSTAAIRRGNTSSEERKTENANVSMRIPTAPAFTRLRNLSSSIGISRLGELSAAARPGDKSLTKIPESKTRGSLRTKETQGFPFGDVYEGRESRNSSERAPEDVTLKNKFWKPRRKLRKSKGAKKFRGDKDVGGKLRRFGKPSRGLTRRGAPSDFKRDSFRNEFSKGERRFRRQLQTGEEVFNTAAARSSGLTDEGSRRAAETLIDYYTRLKVANSKRKLSNIGGNESPKKQVFLESGHSYRKIQSEGNDDPFHFDNKGSKKNSVDKRIEDKFVRISNVLKEDSTETGIIQETPVNFKVVTKGEVAKADIPKIQKEPGDNLSSRENGKSNELFAIHGDGITREQPAELNDTRPRLTAKGSSFATTGSTMAGNTTTITSLITRKDSADKESVSFQSVIDSSLSPSTTKELDYNAAKKIDFYKSKSPIYVTEFAIRQTKIFTRESSSLASRNDYFEVTDGPFRTLSSKWASSSKEITETLKNRSEGERDGTENARFFEFNNSSRITATTFEAKDQPINPGLSSRGNALITEPREISLSDEEGVGSNYTEDPLSEKEEIAELVARIVRQYAAYTPIMPSTPTFDETTEAEALPLEEESLTTATQFTTTVATTTKITDVAFRPPIRLLETTSFPEEMHDEISLDETTFVDETEATTTTHGRTVSKSRFRPDAKTPPKARKLSNKTGKHRQKITSHVTNTKMTEEGVDNHPWYRTTEVQQVIAANRSKSIQRPEGKGEKHRCKSERDYFQNTSSARTSSTVSSGVAQTRGKRSDFIRAAGNRDSSVFYDYESEDEETRRSGRTGLNKNEKSSNVTESAELRSTIEKRLADELDYPASRVSSRDSCESRDRTQKLNAALQDSAARNIRLRAGKDNLDSDAEMKGQDIHDNLKSFTLWKLRQDMKDNAAVHKFDTNLSSRNRKATLVSPGTSLSGPAKIPPPANLSGGSVRERLETDRRSEKQAFGEHMVPEGARTAGANDLSGRGVKPREKSSAGEILPTRARSPENRQKSRETVIRGMKLMMPDDKGETRDLDVAAKSVDKKIPPLFAARQQRREDARKINENSADCRVSVGEQYLRRPRGKVYDTVRKINKIKGKLSVSKVDTRKGRANRLDWHRRGRRLLSNGESGYDDEYYANDESETNRENDSSDNEAIAKRDDPSRFENRSDRRRDRDPRKLVIETDQFADTDAAMLPEERTVAICDAAMLSDNMQANSEEAISRLLIPDINFNRDGILVNAKMFLLLRRTL